MARISAGIPSQLNPLSTPDSTVTKWNRSIFLQRPDAGKNISQSLALSMSRRRDPIIRESVKQAAPGVLDTSIKFKPSSITSTNHEISESKPDLNISIRKSYRNFLQQKKSDGKKENHEVLTITLDKQILKLRAGDKLSSKELENISEAMEKLSAWLSSQMTDDKKINELGSSIKECLVILEKAKAYKANEEESQSVVAEASKSVVAEASQSVSEKNATSQKSMPSNSLSTSTRNKGLLSHFEKHMRESLKKSKSFDYEVTVSMARSILMKLENEGRLSLENLTNEFEEKMKSMARNKISKQKLNAVEIGILNHKLQDSFKNAQKDEAMQQISLEKMRSTLSTNA
jgi:hypothetical protein